MSSFSSRLFVLALLGTSCTRLQREPVSRNAFPTLDPSLIQPVLPVEADGEELYPGLGKLTACDWLNQAGAGTPYSGRFRLIGQAKPISSVDDITDDTNLKKRGPLDFLRFWQGSDKEKETAACRKVRKGSTEPKVVDQCYRDRAELTKSIGINLNRISGRIDIAASPLYQYSLVYIGEKQIPDRQQFLALVDEKIDILRLLKKRDDDDTTPPLPIMLAYRTLMNLGVLDVYDQRNSLTQDIMNVYFPGAFVPEGSYRLKSSFPEAIFKNGSPSFSAFTPGPDDSEETIRRKIEGVNAMLGVYQRDTALFTKPTWDSFREDQRAGLTAAIRGINSKSAVEQACGTMLLHRSFGQMLTVMGYDRPEMREDRETHQSSLPPLAGLLDGKESNAFRVCKTPGSFVRQDFRTPLAREDLLNLSKTAASFSLARSPYVPEPCRDPVSKQSADYRESRGLPLGKNDAISAEQLLEFVSGVTYFSMAFNPGATWWKNGLPMASIPSLESLATSGAVLPTDAHALSLAFLQLSFSNVQDRHLVLIDGDGRETSDESKTMGARISLAPRVTGSGGKVVTTARSAALLAEFAFRFSKNLDSLSNWYGSARVFVRDEDRRLREELAQRLQGEGFNLPDADLPPGKRQKKQELIKHFSELLVMNTASYSTLVNEMFGEEANLVTLVDNGSPKAVRKRLEDLKLISSLMLVSLVQRLPDGRITCFDRLESDVETGAELKFGECSSRDSTVGGSTRELFRQAMGLAAQEYNSPIFREFAQ